MLFNTGTNLKDTTNMMMANSKRQISPVPETDDSTVELAKRPRGRPPGSKNKPKPPVLITRHTEPAASASSSSAFRPHVLEIPAGHDVLGALRSFSRRKRLGVCVLSCAGAVSDVTLRQPPHPTALAPAPPAGTVGLRGRLEVLSLSATVMPPPAAAEVVGVAVTVAGPQGQVGGGAGVGPLVAAGTVTVMAAAFEKPTFHRLPMAEDEDDVAISGGREEKMEGRKKVLVMAQQQQQQQQEPLEQQQHYVHREYPHHQQVVAESCGMGIYSSSFATDVIWAPVARPPHHRPPY